MIEKRRLEFIFRRAMLGRATWLREMAKKTGLQGDPYHNGLLRYLVLVSPFLLELLFIWTFCHYSLWSWEFLSVLLLLVFVGLLGFSFCVPDHPSPTSSPLTFGHVAGGIAIHLIIYYQEVLPLTTDYFFVHLIFQVLLIPYVYLFAKSHFAPAGYYQGPVLNQRTLSGAIQGSGLNCAKFCVTCLVRFSLSSHGRKHCFRIHHFSYFPFLFFFCSTKSPSDRNIVRCVIVVVLDLIIIVRG